MTGQDNDKTRQRHRPRQRYRQNEQIGGRRHDMAEHTPSRCKQRKCARVEGVVRKEENFLKEAGKCLKKSLEPLLHCNVQTVRAKKRTVSRLTNKLVEKKFSYRYHVIFKAVMRL